MISLGAATIMLLLCLFAMGAFWLCEPVRRDDKIAGDDEDHASRQRLVTEVRMFRKRGVR